MPSSGNFNFNGIVFPDRRIQPAYWEVKRVYQYVDFADLDVRRGEIRLTNNYDFINLDGFELHWQLIRNGSLARSGVSDALSAEPNEHLDITLDFEPIRAEPGEEYHLNLQLVSPAARGILPAGHVYAEAQLALPFTAKRVTASEFVGGELTVAEVGSLISARIAMPS